MSKKVTQRDMKQLSALSLALRKSIGLKGRDKPESHQFIEDAKIAKQVNALDKAIEFIKEEIAKLKTKTPKGMIRI